MNARTGWRATPRRADDNTLMTHDVLTHREDLDDLAVTGGT